MNAFRVFLAAALLAGACGKKDEQKQAPSAPAPAPAKVDPMVTAREIFKSTCVMCHGETGRGDGSASASLHPKPRDYTDPTWQANVTDELIKRTFLEGGPAVGKAPTMAAFGNLPAFQDPAVVDAMVELIRSFGAR